MERDVKTTELSRRTFLPTSSAAVVLMCIKTRNPLHEHRRKRHGNHPGTDVDPPAQRQSSQGELAVYDRGCAWETQQTFSDSFLLTVHEVSTRSSRV